MQPVIFPAFDPISLLLSAKIPVNWINFKKTKDIFIWNLSPIQGDIFRVLLWKYKPDLHIGFHRKSGPRLLETCSGSSKPGQELCLAWTSWFLSCGNSVCFGKKGKVFAGPYRCLSSAVTFPSVSRLSSFKFFLTFDTGVLRILTENASSTNVKLWMTLCFAFSFMHRGQFPKWGFLLTFFLLNNLFASSRYLLCPFSYGPMEFFCFVLPCWYASCQALPPLSPKKSWYHMWRGTGKCFQPSEQQNGKEITMAAVLLSAKPLFNHFHYIPTSQQYSFPLKLATVLPAGCKAQMPGSEMHYRVCFEPNKNTILQDLRSRLQAGVVKVVDTVYGDRCQLTSLLGCLPHSGNMVSLFLVQWLWVPFPF